MQEKLQESRIFVLYLDILLFNLCKHQGSITAGKMEIQKKRGHREFHITAIV